MSYVYLVAGERNRMKMVMMLSHCKSPLESEIFLVFKHFFLQISLVN